MNGVSDRLIQLLDRRPWLAAAVLGAGAAVGFPPLHLWPLSLLALALFVLHVSRAPDWKAALARGWFFGWAHLTVANNWIATAFTYQSKMPEFLGWLAVPLLGIYLALYPALAALIAHGITRRLAMQQERASLGIFGLFFAASWILFEWVRSWAFTGYPWPPLGLMLLGDLETAGGARLLPWIGTYGLSGLTLLVGAALAALVAARRWILGGALVLVLTGLMVLPSGTRTSDGGVRFTLVQPNLGQDEINDSSKFEQQFARIADLTLPGNDQSRLVLWPESAIPDYLEDGYPQRYYARMTAAADPEFARRRIGSIIGSDSTLLTGVVNLDIGEREHGPGAISARNSVIALNGAGEIEHSYAKAHLVPFGEYLPMRPILEPLGLSRLVAGTLDYVPGSGPQTLDLGAHGRAGIQICYEIVFSGQVTDRSNRPDYLFNPSNDGWFGAWGPPQHLAQARLRAIEEGLPVLRSTTTGISAVIDSSGLVFHTIGSGIADRVDGRIPPAKPPTLFARFGNALPLAWAALLALFATGLTRLVATRAADR